MLQNKARNEAAAQEIRIQEALAALRDKDIKSTTLERIRITEEADRIVANLPDQLKLGYGLKYILSNISTPIKKHDILLGRIMETVPNEEEEAYFQSVLERWSGWGVPSWLEGGGHICLDWDMTLQKGFKGLADEARNLAKLKKSEGANQDTLDFLECSVQIYEAFRIYSKRYGIAAEKHDDMKEHTDRCFALAEREPRSFLEAMQMVWLIELVICMICTPNPTLTLGRMDDYLLKYYHGDTLSGKLTYKQAGAIIEDFYCKNNIILGRGEHQMSYEPGKGPWMDTRWARNLNYDAPQYLILGGRRRDGSPSTNELTRIFVERIVPRFEDPFIVFRYTDDLTDDLWNAVCDKLRQNATIAVYNDRDIINAYVKAGIDEEDAVNYTMYGCNWPDLSGNASTACIELLPLAQKFNQALSGKDGEEKPDIRNMDVLYERFNSLIREEIEKIYHNVKKRILESDRKHTGMLRVTDCFMDGPFRNLRTGWPGSKRYNNVIISLPSLGSLVDCFSTVDYLVFQTGKVDIDTLRSALADNFAGYGNIRLMCLNSPKFGMDDDRADSHAVRLVNCITDIAGSMPESEENKRFPILFSINTNMAHIDLGKSTGTTPDGRLAGEPLSENLSPYPGNAVNGVTAMLRSICKIPFTKISSGVLNIRLRPDMVKSNEGLLRLSALLKAYFKMGGIQAQVTVASTEELYDAQVHPENHRDLMVRITGYSAVFIDMTREAQNEIIRRQEMN